MINKYISLSINHNTEFLPFLTAHGTVLHRVALTCLDLQEVEEHKPSLWMFRHELQLVQSSSIDDKIVNHYFCRACSSGMNKMALSSTAYFSVTSKISTLVEKSTYMMCVCRE
jgi:hypothetical protein